MTIKLPLFPLNTVFFPGMTLPLHIFEPRYREMINLCIDQRQPFGVVLIDDGPEVGGPEVGGPARPHPIGTYGSISRVERLPDGRLNIEVVGQERFHILTLHHDKAYLTGTVERFPLVTDSAETVASVSHSLSLWARRYLKVLGQIADFEFEKHELPDNPVALAYFAAIIAQVPMKDKQVLLNCPTTDELLQREVTLYKREISLLRALLTSPQARHSPNVSPN